MIFQKIFSELTLKLSGGLLLLKHQVEKLFLSFCRLPEFHFWEPSEPITLASAYKALGGDWEEVQQSEMERHHSPESRGCSLLWREKWFANVTSWDLLVKKRVFFPSHFPALNSLKSA